MTMFEMILVAMAIIVGVGTTIYMLGFVVGMRKCSKECPIKTDRELKRKY